MAKPFDLVWLVLFCLVLSSGIGQSTSQASNPHLPNITMIVLEPYMLAQLMEQQQHNPNSTYPYSSLINDSSSSSSISTFSDMYSSDFHSSDFPSDIVPDDEHVPEGWVRVTVYKDGNGSVWAWEPAMPPGNDFKPFQVPSLKVNQSTANETFQYYEELGYVAFSFTLRNILLLCGYSLIGLVSIIGNVLVIQIINNTPKLRTTTNTLIISLTMSDITTTVCNIPFMCIRTMMQNWPLPDAFCVVMPTVQVCSVYVSTLTMAAIGVHRFRSVRTPKKIKVDGHRSGLSSFPQYVMTKTKIAIWIVMIWCLSLFLSLPHSFFNRVVDGPSPYHVQANGLSKIVRRCRAVYPEGYEQKIPLWLSLETTVTQFVLPLTITGILYYKIARIIQRQGQLARHFCDELNRKMCELKRKRIRMLGLIVVAFGITWLPLNAYHLLIDFHLIHFNYTIFMILHLLAMTSVCCNPFIYCWMNESFRVKAKRYLLLDKIFPCWVSAETSTSSKASPAKNSSANNSKVSDEAANGSGTTRWSSFNSNKKGGGGGGPVPRKTEVRLTGGENGHKIENNLHEQNNNNNMNNAPNQNNQNQSNNNNNKTCNMIKWLFTFKWLKWQSSASSPSSTSSPSTSSSYCHHRCCCIRSVAISTKTCDNKRQNNNNNHNNSDNSENVEKDVEDSNERKRGICLEMIEETNRIILSNEQQQRPEGTNLHNNQIIINCNTNSHSNSKRNSVESVGDGDDGYDSRIESTVGQQLVPNGNELGGLQQHHQQHQHHQQSNMAQDNNNQKRLTTQFNLSLTRLVAKVRRCRSACRDTTNRDANDGDATTFDTTVCNESRINQIDEKSKQPKQQNHKQKQHSNGIIKTSATINTNNNHHNHNHFHCNHHHHHTNEVYPLKRIESTKSSAVMAVAVASVATAIVVIELNEDSSSQTVTTNLVDDSDSSGAGGGSCSDGRMLLPPIKEFGVDGNV